MQEVKVLKENKVYRVGDLFFMGGVRWKKDRESILREDRYKDTILFHYLSNKKREFDYETFYKAVKLVSFQKQYKKPLNDELVIHLRLGDVMSNCDGRYLAMKNIYNDFYREISVRNIKKVTIVTALHFGANEVNNLFFYNKRDHDRSLDLLQSIKSQTERLGLEVNIYSNEDVDADLSYMCYSKMFIPSLATMMRIVNPVRAKILKDV